MRTWLRAICGIEADYKVVHKTVRYRLKSKLKVPRPVSVKQAEGAAASFKKKLPQLLKSIVEKYKDLFERLWAELKKFLKWELFDHLDELRRAVQNILRNWHQTIITSLTGWEFIIEALFVAGI